MDGSPGSGSISSGEDIPIHSLAKKINFQLFQLIFRYYSFSIVDLLPFVLIPFVHFFSHSPIGPSHLQQSMVHISMSFFLYEDCIEVKIYDLPLSDNSLNLRVVLLYHRLFSSHRNSEGQLHLPAPIIALVLPEILK